MLWVLFTHTAADKSTTTSLGLPDRRLADPMRVENQVMTMRRSRTSRPAGDVRSSATSDHAANSHDRGYYRGGGPGGPTSVGCLVLGLVGARRQTDLLG